MKLIVGLGNPGKRYEDTRHNVGFKIVDLFARHANVYVDKPREQALVGEMNYAGEKIMLIKPQTYMNLSGQAVGNIARWHKIESQNILVIYDDLDLPVGQLRLRIKGGAGGHNGVISTIAHLGTAEFPRMRIGIGRPPAGMDVADYVLDCFLPAERELVAAVAERATEALTTWLKKGITAAMNDYSK
jgi:PTH1 family peptidyl-tRNA hydrolase